MQVHDVVDEDSKDYSAHAAAVWSAAEVHDIKTEQLFRYPPGRESCLTYAVVLIVNGLNIYLVDEQNKLSKNLCIPHGASRGLQSIKISNRGAYAYCTGVFSFSHGLRAWRQ